MSNIATCQRPTGASVRSVKRYEIVDSCVVGALLSRDGLAELWYPLIADSPYQRVLDISVEAPWAWEVRRESEHGNQMLHTNYEPSIGGEARCEIRYLVERTPVDHALERACVRRLDTPAFFERSLRAEQFVTVDDKTVALARNVVGNETNALDQARLIYDHVTSAMSYDATQQSWLGSTEHALVCSVGNCNDIHALFISLARSLGIPARLILGQALEPPPPGEEACEACGYHCWAEFFAPGLGWVPVDASCACKYGKHQLFGDLEMNHIAWSVGRDIELNPPQKGQRLLFFAGPYAEINGVAHRALA